MDITRFEKSPTGRVIRVRRPPTEYHAFVPNPLPPHIEPLNMGFIRLATDAERALGELKGIGSQVPNTDFLVIPYTRLEAVTSSRIEGTQASLSELFYFEAMPRKPKPSDDILEVKNYLDALHYGIERLKTLPLSLRLVRELHERLMSGMRGGTADKTPGEIRRSQNWIGSPGVSLNNATFVPPPADALLPLLDNWEKFLHERERLPLLIQCAMMHYQFEVIHPFLDGNGRVGRLLIILFLHEREALPYPLLYLSAFFEKYRTEYYDRLLAVSRDGDWMGWIQFFLEGIVTQSQHAIESANRILAQREIYRQRLQADRASASVLALLDLIFLSPYLTAQEVAEKIDVSFATANKAIAKLEGLGMLQEITGQARNRLYVARQLLNLIVENEPIYMPNNDK